ncbi:minor capsid protein [Fundicoccus sp. Sow4_D5]|uniref:minor capsid protein n=1 Tax=Fundicoccus sp. Sow4_D5 TaxID=3438782 RepID=UPI003F919685
MPKKTRTNAQYWLERSKQQEQHAEELTTEYLAKMYAQLELFQREAIKEIEVFYNRFANDYKMSKHDAIQYLTNNQLKEFQNVTLARYARLAKDPLAEPRLVEALAYRHRISRQEALLAEIELKALEAYGSSNGLIESTYKNMSHVYGSAKIEIAKSYADIGYSVRRPVLELDTIKSRLKTNWVKDNLSERIWGQEEKTYDTIANILDQGFIGQWPQEKIIKEVQKRVSVAKSSIETLVRTEQTAFNSMGSVEQLKAHLETKYKIVAILDNSTTDKCRGEHDNIYDIDDYQIGETAPPFHYRCRSSVSSTRDATLIDYFADEHDYDGPELEDIYEEWENELLETVNQLVIEDLN